LCIGHIILVPLECKPAVCKQSYINYQHAYTHLHKICMFNPTTVLLQSIILICKQDSYHSPYLRWKVKCCSITEMCSKSCHLTHNLNNFDQYLDHTASPTKCSQECSAFIAIVMSKNTHPLTHTHVPWVQEEPLYSEFHT